MIDWIVFVGYGGWGDGWVGDFFGFDVILNDYVLIEELYWVCIVKSSGGCGRFLLCGLFDWLNVFGDDVVDCFCMVVL